MSSFVQEVVGPCKGGVQGFWIQMSNGPRIRDLNFKTARFKIINWARFKFFHISGIQILNHFSEIHFQTDRDS